MNADDSDILFEDQDNILENNLYTYCFNNPVNMVDPDGKLARYASKAAFYGGLALGGPIGTGLVIIGGVLFVYYSGKLIRKGISYYSEHVSTKNGKKRNKHEEGNARRKRDQGGEKKKQKKGWKRPR